MASQNRRKCSPNHLFVKFDVYVTRYVHVHHITCMYVCNLMYMCKLDVLVHMHMYVCRYVGIYV
jgi:hypothetical protein